MIEDGLTKPVLDDTCPESHFSTLPLTRTTCPPRADDYLWEARQPVQRARAAFAAVPGESQALMTEGFKRYPLASSLGACSETACSQFFMFRDRRRYRAAGMGARTANFAIFSAADERLSHATSSASDSGSCC